MERHRPEPSPSGQPSGRRSPRLLAVVGIALLLTLLAGFRLPAREAESPSPLRVVPASILLTGASDRQRLLVTTAGTDPASSPDLTRASHFESLDPEVIHVSPGGIVIATGEGQGVVVVRHGEHSARVEITVRDHRDPPPPTLEDDVIPVLTRTSCNSGPCHGKARGQNGFQLSLLGFDPDFDYRALAQEGRGRRIFPSDPERSLLLLKPLGAVPHGGGVRLEAGTSHHRTLVRWIRSGFPRRAADAPRLVRVEVFPPERLLVYREEQQLRVTAHFSDGSQRDVTHLASFQSSESPIVQVDEEGRLRAGNIPGEAAIMARYQGHIAICKASIPLPGEVPPELYRDLPRYNFIDDLVWKKLERLGLTPSPPAPASTLHRRLYLDLVGRLPTPRETRAYLDDPSPDKYPRLVERLLQLPEHADHRASRWVDLLRPNPYRVGIKAVFNLDAWIRSAFRDNLPHDEFARRILTARGSTFDENPVTVFRDRRTPEERVTIFSQLFLGIRLECARCHHHPFEKWSQEDFYSLAAYFARVGHKGTGLSPPISGSEEIIYVRKSGSVRHPLTGEVLPPRPLYDEAEPVTADRDPRENLAEWMVEARPSYFARVAVNRIWADLFGRGLVEPVDDLRITNPPTNEELLEALAEHFIEVGFDRKKLLATIVNSRVYGLHSLPAERNVADTRNHSRFYRQRLRAEVLLDAVGSITGVPPRFAAHPEGTPAMRLWTHRTTSLFLDTFGRPDPNQDPPCERIPDTSVVQALHLMNSPRLHEMVTSNEGRAASLAKSDLGPREVIAELYLLTYCRYPEPGEVETCLRLFEDPASTSGSGQVPVTSTLSPERRRRQAIEDILWTLLNTPEFVFKH